jgi:phosphoglycerate dehydrogenase-like enzyme
MTQLNALFALDQAAYEIVYAPQAAAQIAERVHVVAPPQNAASLKANMRLMSNVDLLFSGWGAPRVDRHFLDACPNLKVIFYGAGSIKGWATPAIWNRDILVTTANDANAIPVAEYTVGVILFSLKHGWRLASDRRMPRDFQIRPEVPGNYRTVVGLFGMGTIARLLVRMLAPFNMAVLTYDPFLSSEEAARLGVLRTSLEQLFAESDVVSLHVPELRTTRGMITGELLESMKTGATFINTSRGGLVDENAMTRVLKRRPDLQAVLDVTQTEPLPPDSLLNVLPNVVLTPHIAGSQGRECQRMGQYMVEELDRYLSDLPLRWQVRPLKIKHSVHQFT